MSSCKLVIVGAGGFAREVFAISQACGYAPVGFVDPDPSELTARLAPIFGEDHVLDTLKDDGIEHAFVAVGESSVRERLSGLCDNAGLGLGTLVHPAASDLSGGGFGVGSAVYPGAVVMPGCRVGAGALINSGATLGHDTLLADFVSVAPGAHLAGDVVVGTRSFIGIGASVREGVTVGEDCCVGAGSVVVKDVLDGTTVYGVPAKPARSD